MAESELTIKNDNLSAIIERILQESEEDPTINKQSQQEQAEDIIGTYALDMIYSGLAVGKNLNFTYNTLSDLPAAVAACYRRSNGEPTAIEETVKSLAAYFFAVAMNEHGCEWDPRQVLSPFNQTQVQDEPFWAVFRIKTGINRKKDFLLSVHEGCHVMDTGAKRLVCFDVSSLIQDYKSAIGVDLREYGLINIAFDAD